MRVPVWLRITAALWAAVFLFVVVTLPPATREATVDGLPRPVRGAFHIHTVASDGGGTRDDVARAAAAAALDFVILTDHGDGTREPAPPAYMHGVLVIDGVEVTTTAGHYAAFGAARSPYPLGGPPYAVIADIARLGGFGVAAHPDSAKPDLRWRDWNAPIGGLEWINGDSAWRDEGAMTLARAVIDYVFRPGPALAGIVERPARLLQRLDELSRSRRVVALAGADAHARLPLTRDDEPYDAASTVPAPSYTQAFRVFANLVETERPLTGDAAADAAELENAIRQGRVAFAMTALAEPPRLHFQARGQGEGADGLTLPFEGQAGSRITGALHAVIEARTSDVTASGESLVRLSLLHDGRVVAEANGQALSHRVERPRGVWRVEAHLAHRPGVPWILSNPVVFEEAASLGYRRPQPVPAPAASLDIAHGAWAVEKQTGSDGQAVEEEGGQRFSYRLAGGAPADQFAAAVRPTGSDDGWDTVVLTARADSPTRLWVQLRLNDARTGQRWGRSIYLDEAPRTIRIPIRDFAPLEPRASASRPNVALVRDVLIVVDTVNSRSGRAGEILIEQLRLTRQN